MIYLPTLYGSYADGAVGITSEKPMYDNPSRVDSAFPAKIRKQLKWLNVNNTDIGSMVSKAVAKIIGVNVNIQVESKSKRFNTQAESLIEEFKNLGVGELTNTHHFNSALRAMATFEMLEGGIMVRHHYNTAWNIPYKYELVSVDMVDTTKTDDNFEEKKSEITINGIVLNKWGQKTHIWLFNSEDRAESEKVKIEDITYYSEVWTSISQQIAISKFSRILPTLDNISEYGKQELKAAIDAASSGHYMKSTAFNEIMKLAYDQVATSAGSYKDKVKVFDSILERLTGLGLNTKGTTPIPSDDDILFNPNTRDSIYESLNNNSEMKMTSSLGLSDLAIYGKADKANYSALKYINETDGLQAAIKFDDISNKVIREILIRVIKVGIQTGRISERIAYWKKPSSFNKFRYLRQSKIDIEPSRTAQANQTNLEIGVTTEARIVEERDGIKYEDFLRTKFEQEKLKIDQEIKLEVYREKERQDAFKEANLEIPQEVTDKE